MRALEEPPIYVQCTAEEWDRAKASVARKRMTPFFAQAAGYRRSAMVAAINSGVFIKPELAVEFRTSIEARHYRPLGINLVQLELEQERQRKDTDYQVLMRKRLAEQPSQFVSTQQARAILGPQAFAHFFESPEGQMLQRLENAASEARFHGQ
jgi:hypothetical protein